MNEKQTFFSFRPSLWLVRSVDFMLLVVANLLCTNTKTARNWPFLPI